MFFFSLPLSGQNTSEELIVSGHVFDEQSGEVLIAANIYDSTKTHFTTTNAYGFFSLTLPKGTSSVIVSYLGYQNTTLDISQENSSLLKINLKPGQTNLDEVTVTANESLLGGVSEISHTITAEQMTRVPVIFAEPDIQQMLLSTAGVNSVGDGTTGFNVRGG
ncbi:MAG: carboxypeptidase-like regulatory domain-containing protein [Bacteroidetes bacterium]|nr:carboxypeptidase-like regulatory domain-containing protein [Bacteroidota bacterium]MDA0936844.1 carboxypeptidase-like regulatory domain-containing protein [Bacteroidota bacterium]